MNNNPDMSLNELRERFQSAEANLSRIAQQSRDVLTDEAKQADTQQLRHDMDAFKTEVTSIRDDLKRIATQREVDKVVNSVDGVSKTIFATTVKTVTGRRDAAGIRTASPLQLQQTIQAELNKHRGNVVR